MLARALAQPSNLLVLDEPTNDLDLETLDLLQEMIADYPGTVLLVSHDRDFLDRTVVGRRWSRKAAGAGSNMRAATPTWWRSAATAWRRRRSRRTTRRRRARRPRRRPRRAEGPLSFKDKHALETLPARMAELEAEIAKHSEDDRRPGALCARPGRVRRASAALAKAQADLARAEDEWLRLEELREQVEAR